MTITIDYRNSLKIEGLDSNASVEIMPYTNLDGSTSFRVAILNGDDVLLIKTFSDGAWKDEMPFEAPTYDDNPNYTRETEW